MSKETINTFDLTPVDTPVTWSTRVLSILLTFVLDLSFVMMFATTYDIGVNRTTLGIWVFLLTVAGTVFHDQFGKYKWTSAVYILASLPIVMLLIYFNFAACKTAGIDVLNTLRHDSFRFLPDVFGKTSATDAAFSTLMIVLLLFPTAVTTWVLTRRKKVLISILSYMPFFVPSVALTYKFPDQIWCELALTGVILLLIFQCIRKAERAETDKRLLLISLPVLMLALIVGRIYPMNGYDKKDFAKENLEFVLEHNPSSLIQKAYEHFYHLVNKEEDMDLRNQSPIDVPELDAMKIKRVENPAFHGEASKTVYLYMKGESFDTYRAHAWDDSDGEPRQADIYQNGDDQVIPQEEAEFGIFVENYVDRDLQYVPFYTDFYVASGLSGLEEEPARYANTSMSQGKVKEQEYSYAQAHIPEKRKPTDWSDAYLDYAEDECTRVPDSTRKAILNSDVLPEWYRKVYKGEYTWSNFDKVRAVMSYVSQLHPYDEHTPNPPEDADFVVWFLTEAETGYCVHYASTAAILLRMLNVPTRYVSGYFVNSLEDEVTVTTKDAHAWFEFFDPDFGWIMGDATYGNAYASSKYDVYAIMNAYGISYEDIEELKVGKEPVPKQFVTTPSPTNPGLTPTPEDDPSKRQTPTPGSERPDATPEASPTMTPRAGASPTPNHTQAPANDKNESEKKSTPIHVPGWLIVLLAVIAVLALAKALYLRYWKLRFTTGTANARARAYFRYFDRMSRMLKGRVASKTSFIAQKAAFSDEEITEDELRLLIEQGQKQLDALKKKRPWYKRMPIEWLFGVKV